MQEKLERLFRSALWKQKTRVVSDQHLLMKCHITLTLAFFVVAHWHVWRFRARHIQSPPDRAELVQTLHILLFLHPFLLSILKELLATGFWHSFIPEKTETYWNNSWEDWSRFISRLLCCDVWIGFKSMISNKAKYKKHWFKIEYLKIFHN